MFAIVCNNLQYLLYFLTKLTFKRIGNYSDKLFMLEIMADKSELDAEQDPLSMVEE